MLHSGCHEVGHKTGRGNIRKTPQVCPVRTGIRALSSNASGPTRLALVVELPRKQTQQAYTFYPYWASKLKDPPPHRIFLVSVVRITMTSDSVKALMPIFFIVAIFLCVALDSSSSVSDIS